MCNVCGTVCVERAQQAPNTHGESHVGYITFTKYNGERGANAMCPGVNYYGILYNTTPYHTIPYHSIQYHTIPYHTISNQIMPYTPACIDK